MASERPDPWPHCDGPDCGGPLCCDCTCPTCTLVPTVLANMRAWATQLRSFQVALDVRGGDRGTVSSVAGNLLDLAEGIERADANLQARFEPDAPRAGKRTHEGPDQFKTFKVYCPGCGLIVGPGEVLGDPVLLEEGQTMHSASRCRDRRLANAKKR